MNGDRNSRDHKCPLMGACSIIEHLCLCLIVSMLKALLVCVFVSLRHFVNTLSVSPKDPNIHWR